MPKVTLSSSSEDSASVINKYLQGESKRSKSQAGLTKDSENHLAGLTDIQAMAQDPIAALFVRTNLARRIAWLLSASSTVIYAPAITKARSSSTLWLNSLAAGVWLPGLLCTAARHSPQLANRICSTPGLLQAIQTAYLPSLENLPSQIQSDGKAAMRPKRLTASYSVPMPGIICFLRLLAQSSSNIARTLLCAYYIAHKNQRELDTSQLESAFLPSGSQVGPVARLAEVRNTLGLSLY
ncbi:unnamed protein product [Protopolystoma xenopodis]|uniref:Uncharacterized protein n=1 Tax=Protopolystoma xenopodis TaxID=117903 RepID=A0A448XC21_9PLAT|nr:unnamed protein product [Protopolystoma xenopodis]